MPRKPKSHVDQVDAKPATIMVVSADAGRTTALTDKLSKFANMNVRTYSSCSAAFDAFPDMIRDAQLPTAVITDYEAGKDMTGAELAARMKSVGPIMSQIPIYMIANGAAPQKKPPGINAIFSPAEHDIADAVKRISKVLKYVREGHA